MGSDTIFRKIAYIHITLKKRSLKKTSFARGRRTHCLVTNYALVITAVCFRTSKALKHATCNKQAKALLGDYALVTSFMRFRNSQEALL